MPLQSREDYVNLNEHLWELDPIAKAFAETNGYEYGPPLTNGLYPKLRLWRTKDSLSQNINFDMEYTEPENECFDQFFPEIPYSIYAGSWIDDQEEMVRHHGPYAGIQRLPFSALRLSMLDFLSFFHSHNETITKKVVLACGFKSHSPGHPLSEENTYLE